MTTTRLVTTQKTTCTFRLMADLSPARISPAESEAKSRAYRVRAGAAR